MNIHPRVAAFAAIFLWSSGALVVLGLSNLPICQILALSSSVSLVLTAIFLAATRRWRSLVISKKQLFSVASLLIVNQVCYVFAFREAPAAQVDLINYLWPSMLILLTGRFSGRYTGYLVVISGASGIFVALEPATLEWKYLMGYLAAFVAALSWTRYSMLVKELKLPPEFVCLNIGLGAPLYWIAHFFLDETMVPVANSEALLLLLYGGGVYVVAYLSWGYALRFGSIGEAGALSYLIPPLSIMALTLFGYAEFTPRLSWATALVLVASVLPLLSRRVYNWYATSSQPVSALTHSGK